jgi:hypothetical protein
MLITFEGKGCKKCPFWYGTYNMFHNPIVVCVLNSRDNTCTEDLPTLFPNMDKKPDGCPFKGFPGAIEISAMESE